MQSALRGGLMFSRAMLNYLNKRGVSSFSLGGKSVSLRHEDTYLDEAVGYLLAAVGFWVQLRLGFGMPFPLNVVMWP